MTNIGSKIRKVREEKNISQEKIAHELNLSQSSYGRLEKNDKSLNVFYLIKIAEILEVSISYLFNEQASKIINQTNNQNPNAYNVENLYQENKETQDRLKTQYEESLTDKIKEIEYLKQEIAFLKDKMCNINQCNLIKNKENT
jgi:transcriptional regulator with XRE-family HTH domain